MNLFKRLFKKKETPPPKEEKEKKVEMPEQCRGCGAMIIFKDKAKCSGGNRKRRRKLYNCRIKVKRD